MADDEPQAADALNSAKEDDVPPEEENTAHFEPVVSVLISSFRLRIFLRATVLRIKMRFRPPTRNIITWSALSNVSFGDTN
jgi:hypothetical protein